MKQAVATNMPIDDELYRELERACLPILGRAAARYAQVTGCSPNDALQEARVAFVQALRKYDYNKSFGGISNFVAVVVKNSLIKLTKYEHRPKRMPKGAGAGDKVRSFRPYPVPDFDGFAAWDDDPETTVSDDESRRLLNMKLVNRLNERQRLVFACMAHPSEEFQTYMRNIGLEEPTVKAIATFLGVSKNVVDWSIHQIKRHFTDLFEAEFREAVEIAVKSGVWPMFYISRKFQDTGYVRHILSTRKLNPRPVAPCEVVDLLVDGVRIERSIEWYSWGSVIMLRFGERTATVIAEGRFNPLTGNVLKDNGFWKPLSNVLDWYPEMVHAIRHKSSRRKAN